LSSIKVAKGYADKVIATQRCCYEKLKLVSYKLYVFMVQAARSVPTLNEKAPRCRDAFTKTKLAYTRKKTPWLKTPAHKGFHGGVFGKAEFVVQFCSVPVAVFCPLPKLPAVCTLEHYAILLALVLKDAVAFF